MSLVSHEDYKYLALEIVRDDLFESSLLANTVHGEMHGTPCKELASWKLPNG